MRWLAGELREVGVELFGHAVPAGRTRGRWLERARCGLHRVSLVGADGAKSRGRTRWPGRARSHGGEPEFDGMRLAQADARTAPVEGIRARLPAGAAGADRRAGRVASRYRGTRSPVPDADAFLLRRAGDRHRCEAQAGCGCARDCAPCGGPIREIAADGAILTGDVAGIVSPLTAGGIHSAWKHGWRWAKPSPATCATADRRRNRSRDGRARLPRETAAATGVRHAADGLPFDLLIGTPALRWAAERVYFNR